jgi:hypothetical protein
LHDVALAKVSIAVHLLDELNLVAVAHQHLGERAAARPRVALHVACLRLDTQATPIVQPIERVRVRQKLGRIRGEVNVVAASAPPEDVLDQAAVLRFLAREDCLRLVECSQHRET